MSNLEKTKNALANIKPPETIQSLISNEAPELHLNKEMLTRIALTAIRLNPQLAACTPASFFGSLLVLSQLGLDLVNGQAYLIPFVNKRKIGNDWKSFKEVQFVAGYRGYISLFYKHESAVSIDAQEVCQNDNFSYEYGTNSFLKHKPALKDRGDVIAYYAIAKMKDGGVLFKVMSKDECMEHGKLHSKTFDRTTNQFYSASPWSKEPDAMCRKTALLQLCKMLPLSIEFQKAIMVDETSREYRKGIDNALDLPDNTDWQENGANNQEALPSLPQEPIVPPSEEIKGKQGKELDISDTETPKERTIDEIRIDSELYGKIEKELQEASTLTELKKVLNTRFAQISKMPQENQDQLKELFEDRKRTLMIK